MTKNRQKRSILTLMAGNSHYIVNIIQKKKIVDNEK